MTTREEARAFFDSIAGRYDRVYAPPREESQARMARVLAELAPGSRILDLGVGTGRELSSLLDAGHLVTGVDLSPEMLARCARRSRPVPLVEADLWGALPFAPGSFDAVLALHGTLAHPPSKGAPRALAAEVARVLAARGVFLVEVPLPAWIDDAASEPSRGQGDDRRVSRIDATRSRVTDGATGAFIEAWLFPPDEWREALSSSLTVERAIEERTELFLLARRGDLT